MIHQLNEKDMTNLIQLYGIQSKLNVIDMGQELGVLKELILTCSKEIREKIITEAVKRGVPFERISTGVKLFQ